MTFTYKLSRRLALGHLGLTAFAAGVIAACSGGEPTSPATSGTTDLLAAVRIAPKKATIETNQAIRFFGTGFNAAGDSMATSIEWTATGGSITADGLFSASTTGNFRVIGKGKGHTKSDTSTVVVVPPQPTLTSIVVTPDPATAAEGTTVSFSASGKLSDGSTTAIGVVWSATGGTIDAGGNYTAGMTPGTFRVVATNTSSTVGDTVPVAVNAPQLAQVVLAPATVTLVPGATQQLTAYGRTTTGDSISTPVSFTATGGTVSAGGLYTAGQTTGTFRVIATSTTTNLADTSAVTIQAAALAQLILAPALATVATGGTVQFGVYGRTTAGDSVGAQATYTATGGTINSAGLYTAGSTAGTFRVIATASGKADTSAVTITDPSTPSGIAIYPGQSIQSAVNANPAGTTFILKAGTHQNQTVIPKSNDVFLGEPGTVMDGGSTVGVYFAFYHGTATPYPANVTIQGITIQHYASSVQHGAIQIGDDTRAVGSRGWTVQNCEIRYNAYSGIRLHSQARILNNYIHHNGNTGYLGIADSTVLDSNEIAFNNYLHTYTLGNEAGGGKIVQSTGAILRNNYVHDNWGPGMWTDGDNFHTLYENNRVVNNAGPGGIFHEISWDAIIRNNIVIGNGLANIDWYYGAGIMISDSKDVEVYGNTVSENARGIIGIMQNRGSGPNGTYTLDNLYVHDNTVTMTIVADDGNVHNNVTGIAQDIGDLSYFTSHGNRFVHNTYHLGTAAHYFTWNNPELSEQQWVGFGQDVTGTFIR